MSERAEIVDVGPRDGLQSQPKILGTETKIILIQRLIDAGIKRIEVASFVNPKRVPQMADADDVIAGLPKYDDVSYIGLVLNEKGFDRALLSGIDQINCVAVATDTFCERNQGKTAGKLVLFITATLAWNKKPAPQGNLALALPSPTRACRMPEPAL